MRSTIWPLLRESRGIRTHSLLQSNLNFVKAVGIKGLRDSRTAPLASLYAMRLNLQSQADCLTTSSQKYGLHWVPKFRYTALIEDK